MELPGLKCGGRAAWLGALAIAWLSHGSGCSRAQLDLASQAGDARKTADAQAPADDIDAAAPSSDSSAPGPDVGSPEDAASQAELDAGGCGDTQTDPQHCGSCGHACLGAGQPGVSCVAGRCEVSGCTFGDHGEHSYAYCSTPLGWQSARERCQSLDMDLADLLDASERTFAQSLAQSAPIWIGLNDLDQETEYHFVTPRAGRQGRKVYSGNAAVDGAYAPWARGQPDSFGEEDCVVVFPGLPGLGGGYNDQTCLITFGFLCESI